MDWLFTLVIFLICDTSLTKGVIITEFRVPIRASHEAPLDCKYDLQGDGLYDVKWYKDNQQFFRCLPKDLVQDYDVEGVHIEHSGFSRLGSCQLNLIKLGSKSTGEYKCEVTAEGPAFKMAAKSAKLIYIERKVQNKTTAIKGERRMDIIETNEVTQASTTENDIPNSALRILTIPLFICLYSFANLVMYM